MARKVLSSTKEELKKILMVCKGKRLDGKNRILQEWQQVDEDGNSIGNAWYLTPIQRTMVGGVYVAHITVDRESILVRGDNAPSYSHKWRNAAEVSEWWSLEQAAEGKKRRAALARKELDDKALLEILAPIRKAMKETDGAGRTAIIAAVIDALMRGSGIGWL